MTSRLILLIAFCLVFALGSAQCFNQYENDEWKLKACIDSSWYPKVESKSTITFFGNDMYHLKIDKEIRQEPYGLKNMLATFYSPQLSKGYKLQKTEDRIKNTFVATYLTNDGKLEVSFAVHCGKSNTFYFQFVKEYDQPLTHNRLITFIKSIDLHKSQERTGATESQLKKFEKDLKTYIFNFQPNSKITVGRSFWDEMEENAEGQGEQKHFDFATYWENSRKSFCDTIQTLKSPKIFHFNMTPESQQQEGTPFLYYGELFVMHDHGEIKSRFTSMLWKDELLLMNIKIPE